MYDKIDVNHRVYKGFNIVTEPPYGLWVIRTFDNKPIDQLSGRYTMVSQAVKDIEIYLSTIDVKKKK